MSMSAAKRLKTTHELPATTNGSTLTIVVDDDPVDAATVVQVSVVRADRQQVPEGRLDLKPTAADGDGTLRCLSLPPEQAARLLENINPHPLDSRIKFRESDHKPVY